MQCRATKGEWVRVESSDKTWSTGEGNGKPPQSPYLENPMDSVKWQKDKTLTDESPRLEDATGEEPVATTNSSRKNMMAGPSWR